MRHSWDWSLPPLPQHSQDQMLGWRCVVGADPVTGTNNQVLLLSWDILSSGLGHHQLRKLPANVQIICVHEHNDLTPSLQSSCTVHSDQTRSCWFLISQLIWFWLRIVFVSPLVVIHWRIWESNIFELWHWNIFQHLVILAEWDLVLSLYLADGSNMSPGFLGRWISDEG